MNQLQQSIVNTARAYLGAPWLHCGRNGDGLDCVGLLVAVARDTGLKHRDPAPYARMPRGQALTDELSGQFTRVMHPQPADILVFAFDRARMVPQHVGIKTDTGFIHSVTDKEVVEVELDARWLNRLVDSYRFGELTWQRSY